MTPRQAVLLVGGKGTRLGALAGDAPKPLVEIAPGKVFLDYLIAWFRVAGVTEFLLLAGHRAEVVEARYGAMPGFRVLREESPAGTAGALRLAREALSPVFFMANGDSLFDFSAPRLAAALSADALGALALRRVEDARRYGTVALAAEGRIAAFREKDAAAAGPALINGGLYCLRAAIADEIGPSFQSLETDVFPRLAARGALRGAAFEGYFIDIGLPDTLAQARAELPERFP